MSKSAYEKRMFIGNNKNYHHLLTFDQGKDGSIYCSFPTFKNIIWQTISNENGTYAIKSETAENAGKLSIHGNGRIHISEYGPSKKYQLILYGNRLRSEENKNNGVRHLFTIFPQEQYCIPPNSPAFSRSKDHVLNFEQMNPFVMIFFAVPVMKNYNTRIQLIFHTDDLQDPQQPLLGYDKIRLRNHDIIWLCYKPKHFDKWPKKKHTYVIMMDLMLLCTLELKSVRMKNSDA